MLTIGLKMGLHCGNKDWDDGMGLIVQLNDYWEFVIPIMQVSVIKLPTSKLT